MKAIHRKLNKIEEQMGISTYPTVLFRDFSSGGAFASEEERQAYIQWVAVQAAKECAASFISPCYCIITDEHVKKNLEEFRRRPAEGRCERVRIEQAILSDLLHGK